MAKSYQSELGSNSTPTTLECVYACSLPKGHLATSRYTCFKHILVMQNVITRFDSIDTVDAKRRPRSQLGWLERHAECSLVLWMGGLIFWTRRCVTPLSALDFGGSLYLMQRSWKNAWECSREIIARLNWSGNIFSNHAGPHSSERQAEFSQARQLLNRTF